MTAPARAPSVVIEPIRLNGTRKDGSPIPQCHGDYQRAWLLIPGWGVYLLVAQEKIEPARVAR